MKKTVLIVGSGLARASAKAASDLEKHFAELSTIADTSKKTVASINDLKKQLRRLSEETGQSQSDLAEDTCKKYTKSIFDEKSSLYAFVKARSSNHTNWRYSRDTSNFNE